MANMMDYLAWRGDILFSQLGMNDVDALILSTLAYIRYDGLIPEGVQLAAPMRTVAKTILALPEPQSRCRVEKDLKLLEAVADSERFGRIRITDYRTVFIPEEETQFAAMTFLLDDGSAFLAFRGTDNTLVGWKEDFNMSFRDSVPAQVLAKEYVERFAAENLSPLYLGGHSKGGNLAVYAAIKCSETVQKRITRVYNHDGPGFRGEMLGDPGYLRIAARVISLVPQSSVFGMLMERLEMQKVIHSDAVSLLQHEPYTWSVQGKDLVEDVLTESALNWDRTLTNWLSGLTNEERSQFFDGLFELLMLEDAARPRDVLRPQNILAALKSISQEEDKRRMMGAVLQELLESAKTAHN